MLKVDSYSCIVPHAKSIIMQWGYCAPMGCWMLVIANPWTLLLLFMNYFATHT